MSHSCLVLMLVVLNLSTLIRSLAIFTSIPCASHFRCHFLRYRCFFFPCFFPFFPCFPPCFSLLLRLFPRVVFFFFAHFSHATRRNHTMKKIPPPFTKNTQHNNHQSMNLFVQAPDYGRLTSMHFYAWKKGLKTGMYYLRSRPAADAIPFTLDPAAATSRRSATGIDMDISNAKGAVASDLGAAAFPKEREIHGEVCISCQG